MPPSPAAAVPPLPFPLSAEETQDLGPAGRRRAVQPPPARPEERVAAHLPRGGGLPLHGTHADAEAAGQNQ